MSTLGKPQTNNQAYTTEVDTYQATLRDSSDTLIDPDSIVFVVVDPNGTTTQYTYDNDVSGVKDAQITKVSNGVYSIDIEYTLAGTYTIGSETIGAIKKVSFIELLVSEKPWSLS